MFGLEYGFERVDLCWFVGKDKVVWIKGKMVWFEWIWVKNLDMMWLIKFNKL